MTNSQVKISEKAVKGLKKHLKDLQKVWRNVAEEKFKRVKDSLAAWKPLNKGELKTFAQHCICPQQQQQQQQQLMCIDGPYP